MQKAELGAKIAAIITAMVAVIVFAVNIFNEQEIRYQTRIDVWRKAQIQEIFQQPNNQIIEFGVLMSRMKEKAMDSEELNVSREDLTKGKVRILLSELIASGIINQVGQNKYALRLSAEPSSISERDLSNYLVPLPNAIKREIARVVKENMPTQRLFHYLGEVTCGGERTFKVPEATTTKDWIVFGIDPYITTEYEGDNIYNNSLMGYGTDILSAANDKAWKVRFLVRTNFAAGTGEEVRDCSEILSRRAVSNRHPSIHFVSFRKEH